MSERTSAYYKNLKYYKNQKPPTKGKKWTDDLFPPNGNSFFGRDKNGKYTDPYLTNEEKMYFFSFHESDLTWVRASDLFKGSKYFLFEGKIEAEDIIQGAIGDCYLLSACGALAEYPNMIYQMFKTKTINAEGYFEIILFIDGTYQIVLIDDYLPVEKFSGALYSAHVRNNELWVVLLEKAWAKVNGGYQNIDSGVMGPVLYCFTGFPSQEITHSSTKEDVFYTLLDEANKRDSIMTCGTTGGVESTGLVNNHAYTLIDLPIIKSKGKEVKLVKVRNVYGFKEWNGDWSDHSKLWGKEEKAQVNFVSRNDGIFHMSFKDYYEKFRQTDICNVLYDSYTKFFTISGTNVQNGNVFSIYLDKDGYFSISLCKKNWRFHRELRKNHEVPAYIAIVQFNPTQADKSKVFTRYDANMSHNNDPTITKFLKKGYYLVYAYRDVAHSNLDKKEEDSYVVKLDSTVRFKYKVMPVDQKAKNFPLLKQIIIQGVVDLKGIPASNPIVSFANRILIDGMSHFVAHNPKKDDWMICKLNLDKIKNVFMLSPYEQKEAFKVIVPPGEMDCILGLRMNTNNYSFGVRISTQFCKSKPSDYVPSIKPDFTNYLDNSISSINSSADSYYDYITLPLNQAKKDLSFETLSGNKKTSTKTTTNPKKNYDNIKKEVQKLPKVSNDSELKMIMSSSDKVCYIGQVNGSQKKEGRGATINIGSKVAIGIYKNGLLNGKGTIYKDSTLKKKEYEGIFINGKKNGKGIEYFSSGNRYEGDFVNDIKEGKGVYYFASGNKWEGPFSNNTFNGSGTYTNKNGTKKTIKYADGKVVG